MYRYLQSTGELFDRNNILLATGYSGSGTGKNNPQFQKLANVGPIPQGHYYIKDRFDSQTHGPVCLRLCSSMENEMYGRSGFLIHGDSIGRPGMASQGCIVIPRPVRLQIAGGQDRDLLVVA